ncbi:amidase signature enzyme [Epithele typhae]|uniref:amidase signature enzyme n=1 Tax=Epithele typhae TaxID=378194 RepID=UPI002008135A|nr:amidase signature enzyme [Epithele typhae]KAH9935917.1 amidase signature enzyme [Epithele typhae]
MWPFSTPAHIQVARRKQAARADALRDTTPADPFSPKLVHERYLYATASEIVRQIAKREWTASEVLEAYIARAALAQELTNCLTEAMFGAARKHAKALDAEFASTGRLRGPLHGVPVSFKDTYDVKGQDTTMGYSSRAGKPSAEESMVVALVRKAGGIPLTKTNVPQCIFFFECSNPVWGRSLNPYSRSYTCGGTSGGEAALLALDGAALGWGSDIGGSLRIPAAFCGVYSLKPGFGRVSMAGAEGNWSGFEGIRTVNGPMGRSVDDLELASRLVFGQAAPGESYPAPLPFRDVDLAPRLRFGFYTSDGFVRPSPANQRAVREAVDALRRAGHECVEVRVPDIKGVMEIFMGITAADGYKTISADLGRDPIDNGVSSLLLGPSLFGWLRTSIAFVLERCMGDPMLASVVRETRSRPVHEFHKCVKQRDEYTARFYREVWDKHQLDGIIAPTLALPALPHNSCQYLATIATACLLYNVVDSPVGTLPVSRVDPAVDRAPAGYDPAHAAPGGSPLVDKLLYGPGGFYDADAMAGIPVGVQLVGRRWEEERVLGMMRVLDAALGPRDVGRPGSWTGQGA